jgi:tetratricopeptide (TPR) repeat protein
LIPQIPDIPAFSNRDAEEADTDQFYEEADITQEVVDDDILEENDAALAGEIIESDLRDDADPTPQTLVPPGLLAASGLAPPPRPPRKPRLPTPTDRRRLHAPTPSTPVMVEVRPDQEQEVITIASQVTPAAAREGSIAGREKSALQLGIELRDRCKPKQAIVELQKAIEAGETPVFCLAMIGLCYVDLGMDAKAISTFKNGLFRQEVTGAEATALHYELGRAYERLEEWDEALYYYNRVTKIDPNFRDTAARVQGVREMKRRG